MTKKRLRQLFELYPGMTLQDALDALDKTSVELERVRFQLAACRRARRKLRRSR